MKHLVIGNEGEIGSAVQNVLSEKYDVDGIDKGDGQTDIYDVIHVCIPGNLDNFVDVVKEYQAEYLNTREDGLTIVHSTVPIGTCDKLGAVHSPVRGIHPNLEGGIKEFEKFFGGERAEEASEIFRKLNIRTITAEDARSTEAMKIWSTTQYGIQIVVQKAIHEFCEENGLDFDIVYKEANLTYNLGYSMLGHPEYKKPILKQIDGPIEGHCVIPNLEMLDHELADFIKEKNKGY